jgi:hypothetical protein
MTTEKSKSRLLVVLIVVGGIFGIIVDNGLEGEKRALAQMVLWTVLLFAFVLIQIGKSLKRPIQLLIAVALLGMHVCLLVLFRNSFPLSNMIVGFVGMAVEAVILIFLYARIGQSLDPKGPFGMTEAERDARAMKRAEWRKVIFPTRPK